MQATEELIAFSEADTIDAERDYKIFVALRKPEWLEPWKEGRLAGHKFAGLFPMASKADQAKIRASIERDGFDRLKPIVIYQGKILDGRNRGLLAHTVWSATRDDRHLPYFCEFHGSELAALAYVRRHNLDIRSLNPTQKALAANRIYVEYVELRRRYVGGAPPAGGDALATDAGLDEDDTPANGQGSLLGADKPSGAPKPPRGPSAKAAAALTGASSRQTERVNYIERHGPEVLGEQRYAEAMAAMDDGELAAKAVETEIHEKKRELAAEEARKAAERAAALLPQPAGAEQAMPGREVLHAEDIELRVCDAADLLEALAPESVDSLVLHVPPWGDQPWDWWDRLGAAAAEALTLDGEVWILEDSLSPAVHSAREIGDTDHDWPGLVLRGRYCTTRPERRDGWDDALVWITHLTRDQEPELAALRAELGSSRVLPPGTLRPSETVHGRHPQQLTVALLRGLLAGRRGRVADPCCGSGAAVVAALGLGRPVVAGDSAEGWAEVARLRAAEVLAERSKGQTGLFDVPTGKPVDALWQERAQHDASAEDTPEPKAILVGPRRAALDALRLTALAAQRWPISPTARAHIAAGLSVLEEVRDNPSPDRRLDADEQGAVGRLLAAVAPSSSTSVRARLQKLSEELGVSFDECPVCGDPTKPSSVDEAECTGCGFRTATAGRWEYREHMARIFAELAEGLLEAQGQDALRDAFDHQAEHDLRMLIDLAELAVERRPGAAMLECIAAEIGRVLGHQTPLVPQLRYWQAEVEWNRDTAKMREGECINCESNALDIDDSNLRCGDCGYAVVLDAGEPWNEAEELLGALAGAETQRERQALMIGAGGLSAFDGCHHTMLTLALACERAIERELASPEALALLRGELERLVKMADKGEVPAAADRIRRAEASGFKQYASAIIERGPTKGKKKASKKKAPKKAAKKAASGKKAAA